MAYSQTTIALAVALAIVLVVIIIYAERRREKNKAGMTPVYGRSFFNLPHGPLHPVLLDRAAVSAAPDMRATQVAGGSFAHLLG